MSNFNLGKRPFKPNIGASELVYHNDNGTIYAVIITPYEINNTGVIYSSTWYNVDQNTGMLLRQLPIGPSNLTPICFKNQFTYTKYIPSSKHGLLIRANNMHFPIRSIQRINSAYDLSIDTTLQATSGINIPSTGTYIYRLSLSSIPEDISTWKGARIQSVDSLSPTAAQYAVIRYCKIRNNVMIIATESPAPFLTFSTNTTLYIKGRTYESRVTVDDINPFNGLLTEVEVDSVAPVDYGFAVYGANNEKYVWCRNDKIRLRPNCLVQPQSPHTASTLYDLSLHNKNIGANCYLIWYDGVWNIISKKGSGNIEISPYNNNLNTCLTFLEGVARCEYNVGMFNLGRIRYEHAEVPGSANSYGYNAPISWAMTDDFVIQFPQNSIVFLGDSPSPFIFDSADTTKRRLCLSQEIAPEFLSYDTKPGLNIDNRGVASVIYVADTLTHDNFNNLDEKVVVEYKTDRNPWAANCYWSGGWGGITFLSSLNGATSNTMYQNSCLHNTTRWTSTLEYWNGPSFIFNNGFAANEYAIFTNLASEWFDHKCITGDCPGEILDYRNTLMPFSWSDKYANYGNDGWNYRWANTALNLNRWKSLPIHLGSVLKLLNNNSSIYGCAIFARREQNTNFAFTDAFTVGNRFQFSVNWYRCKDLDNWNTNNLSHLFVAGQPTPKDSVGMKYLRGWHEGCRRLWWDTTSWRLSCIGGGYAYNETSPTIKGNWVLADINVLDQYNNSINATYQNVGDEWFTQSIDEESGYTINHNEVYVAKPGTYILGGDSRSDAYLRSWVDTSNNYDSNIAIPYIPHIADIKITPENTPSKIEIVGSSPQNSDFYIVVGQHGTLWGDMDPLNTTKTSFNVSIHNKTWRVERPNSVIANIFQQPRTDEILWDWRRDLPFKDGRQVKFGSSTTDGSYHIDFCDFQLPDSQYAIFEKTKSIYGAMLNSLFSLLKEIRLNGMISTPNYFYTEQCGYRLWVGNFIESLITGNMSLCPVLLSKGRSFLLNAKTEKQYDLNLVNIGFINYNNTDGKESIPNRYRTIRVYLSNNGTQSIEAVSIKAYIINTYGSKILLAQSNTPTVIQSKSTCTCNLLNTVNAVPFEYGKNRAQVEITDTNNNVFVLNTSIEDGFDIKYYPNLRVINDLYTDYAIVMDSDSSGTIRNVITPSAGLLDIYKKQVRATRGHHASWYFKIHSVGDMSHATVSNIVPASSYLEISDVNNANDKTVYAGNSISSSTLSPNEFCEFITTANALSGNQKRMQVYIYGNITGLNELIPVGGYTINNGIIAETHNLEILEDSPSFSITNFVVSQLHPMQEDDNYIYLQENANWTLSYTINKQSGSSSISTLGIRYKWNPVLGGNNAEYFGNTTLTMLTNSVNMSYIGFIYPVTSINQLRDLCLYPETGVWRDNNFAPITISQIQLNHLPIQFYSSPQAEILSIEQTSNGFIRVNARYYTGVANSCKLRFLVNEKMALVVNASSGDTIDYGYASNEVITDNDLCRCLIQHAGNVVFGVNNLNPDMNETQNWLWSNVPTQNGMWHYITADLNCKHWAYHGGRTNTYNSYNDGNTVYPSRTYLNGLKEYQGPLRIRFDVESSLPPIGNVSNEKNFLFSYKRPILYPVTSSLQDYKSHIGSFVVPSYVIYAAQNPVNYTGIIKHSDKPVNEVTGWTQTSGAAGSTNIFTISESMRYGWAGRYFKVLDAYGNSNYQFFIRPHDINNNGSNNIPSNNNLPIPRLDSALGLKSGSLKAYISASPITDFALKNWSINFRLWRNGTSTDYTLSPGNGWTNKHTSLIGRWVVDASRLTGTHSRVWNFQSDEQIYNSNPSGSLSNCVIRGGYTVEGVVDQTEGSIVINNSIIVITNANTIYENIGQLSVGDFVGIEGLFIDEYHILASKIIGVNRLDGYRDEIYGLEWNNTIQQHVLSVNTMSWNTILRCNANFWLIENSNVYNTFFITYKIPFANAHPSRRRTDDGRLRAFIEVETWTGKCFAKSFSVIDDDTWHTSIVPQIASTPDQIKQVRIRFHLDNRDESNYPPLREISGTISSGFKFYIANFGFGSDNFLTTDESNVFACEYNLPVILNGCDGVQLGITSTDYANNTKTDWRNNIYYIKPKDPGQITLIHEDSNNGLLRAKIVDIETFGEDPNVEYRIGYASNELLSNPIYIDDGQWHTYTEWKNGNFVSNILLEGHYYYFFAIARNPNAPNTNPVYNANYQTPYITMFFSGYITPIITYVSHLSRAIHNPMNGSYLDTNRKEWAQGTRQNSRATNYNQTHEGFHFKSRWYDGVNNWMPNISCDSLDKLATVRLWNVSNNFPVDGWCYSVTYGAETKLSIPNTFDNEIIGDYQDEKELAVAFNSLYRGYAYIHIRPYYLDANNNKQFFAAKHTVHLAFYLEFQDGINPSPGHIKQAYADGIVEDIINEPNWDNAIYKCKVIPLGTYGIKDTTNICQEEEEGIRWRIIYRKVGSEVTYESDWNLHWTYNGSVCNENNAPSLNNLLENTQYEVAIQAYSEGGTWGSVSEFEKRFYTNIRPVQTIIAMIPESLTHCRIKFNGLSSENGNGFYKIWNYGCNESIGIIAFSGQNLYDVIHTMTPGYLGSFILISHNGDGIALPNYPFKKHFDNNWKPGLYTYMQPLCKVLPIVSVGYDNGKYINIKPQNINVDTILWYDGNNLHSDNFGHNPIDNYVEYSIRVFKKHDNIEECIGCIDALNIGSLTDNLNNSWIRYNVLIQNYKTLVLDFDPKFEYGFQINARKVTDIRKSGESNLLSTSQYEICDYPEGDQTIYSGWSDIVWTKVVPNNTNTNVLHLLAKWDYSEPIVNTYAQAGVFQDIEEHFEALRDFRLAFKIISGETTNIFNYPQSIFNLNIVEGLTPTIPICYLLLKVKVLFKDNTVLENTTVLWTNCNATSNLNNLNKNLSYYDGSWNGIGVKDLDILISDDFSKINFSKDTRLISDQWYYIKDNLINRLNLSNNLINIKKIRIYINAIASKGNLYNISRPTIDTNWGSELWKTYDECQIGVLIRNISIGWTSQIDKLGRQLYDSTAWDKEYWWRTANLALKYNNLYNLTFENFSKPTFRTLSNEFFEKQGLWSPSQKWNYNSYVKNFVPEEINGDDIINRFTTD